MSAFDAIVIGGGPAGSATAVALAGRGWSVAVVEQSEFPRRKVCGEFISAASLPVLDGLGIGRDFRALAGPDVRRVALYAGQDTPEAPMPAADGAGFGRAMGRDVLDELLLERAASAGATVFQPWRAVSVAPAGAGQAVEIAARDARRTLTAPVVIAAHGSWTPGELPSQLPKRNAPGDLLGFKAHFRGGDMPADLMPLLAFPGGYGGMVWADNGRLSMSCCVRRDVLERLRAARPGQAAGEAVHAHILENCAGVRRAIGGAETEGAWLAAGPIRPGIRPAWADDVFRAGNAAGESHPIIAEGISMAIQSGWLLAGALDASDCATMQGRRAAAARYQRAWRAQFALRVRAASAFAGIALHPGAARPAAALVRAVPAVLTLGARLSGKARTLPAEI